MPLSLSSQELQTLASYEQIAVERAKRRSDSEWWRSKFEYFRNLVPSGFIVDIGCGIGNDALLFSGHDSYCYVGVDISPAMIALTKQYAPQSMFMRMSMYQLGFQSSSFDGFWAAASLLHIPKCKTALVLHEIYRIMKPGAVGFFALREGDTEEMVMTDLCGDNRFYAFYRQKEFCRILEKNGFFVIRTGRDLREYDPKNPHSAWLFFFVRRAV